MPYSSSSSSSSRESGRHSHRYMGKQKFMDPNSAYDFTLLGFALAATLPFLVANGALFAHRKRYFFRAQGGVYLILGSSIAGLVWIASQFVNNGHFSRDGPFRSCVLWFFWLQGLGASLWFVLIVLRLRRMYELSHNADKWVWKSILFVAFCVLPVVILSTVAASSHFDHHSSKNKHVCKLSNAWKIAIWLVYTPYWLLLLVFIYRLRNQQDPLVATEYTHTLEYIALAIIVVFLSGITIVTGASESVSGRCFLTFSTCCLVFSHFWMRFGWPVYLCLFKPSSDMDRYEQELTQAGARALESVYSQRFHFPSSEGAIWQAFAEASEELDGYKDQIQRLQADKLVLEEKIRELKLKKRKMSESGDSI